MSTDEIISTSPYKERSLLRDLRYIKKRSILFGLNTSEIAVMQEHYQYVIKNINRTFRGASRHGLMAVTFVNMDKLGIQYAIALCEANLHDFMHVSHSLDKMEQFPGFQYHNAVTITQLP